MKLAIYNENCIRAGHLAADEEAIDSHRDRNDGEDCGDWTVYEGSKAELLDQARTMLDTAPGGASGQFTRRSALAIIDNDAGRHCSEYESADWLSVMESLGMIAMDRPVDRETGIPYNQEFWSVAVADPELFGEDA